MSVAWTTILIIVLLSPGVFFFIGCSMRERYAREIIKSNAIGDIGWAILIAIIIHLLAWWLLACFGYDLSADLKQIADYENIPPWLLVDHGVKRIVPTAFYILGTAAIGLIFGCLFSWTISRGLLQFLATHKWINQVMRSMKRGLVTAYVMTTTKENKRILMYKGILAEFYLSPDGKFTYLILKSCSRFFMKFEEDAPTTTTQLQLFGTGQDHRPQQVWDYLLIDGANVANVLFDPSPQIRETSAGDQLLNEEIAALSRHFEQSPQSIDGRPTQ